MRECGIDIPVFLIFFNRPDTFKMVFEAVREARPSKLFLACDGPRNEKDRELSDKCKDIAENIDWDCEVHKNYSEENLGCGMRMYSGIKWAFEYVDRLAIFEDDCVPSQDFFPFAAELLEKYKDDKRVHMINAMNHLIEYKDSNSDYFFSGGCCWGWATWKRVWDTMDFEMSFLDKPYYMKCANRVYPSANRGFILKNQLDSGKRLSTWTYQAGMNEAFHHRISIVPSVNMVTNIGLTEESGHAVSDKRKLCRKAQQYFDLPVKNLEFPLKHPLYMIYDPFYMEKVQKKFRLNFFDKCEQVARRVIYAEKGEIKSLIKRIPQKMLKKR